MEIKKVVLKLDLHDDKCRQKAMKAASGISGVDSVAFEMKDQKMTVTGDIDPVMAVKKLKKLCHVDIVSVGPAKEPEKKKEEPKKEEPKKPAEKKDPPKEPLVCIPWPCPCPSMAGYPPPPPYYPGCGCMIVEENPVGCVIC